MVDFDDSDDRSGKKKVLICIYFKRQLLKSHSVGLFKDVVVLDLYSRPYLHLLLDMVK